MTQAFSLPESCHFSALSPDFRGTEGLTLSLASCLPRGNPAQPAFSQAFAYPPRCRGPSRAPSRLDAARPDVRSPAFLPHLLPPTEGDQIAKKTYPPTRPITPQPTQPFSRASPSCRGKCTFPAERKLGCAALAACRAQMPAKSKDGVTLAVFPSTFSVVFLKIVDFLAAACHTQTRCFV